MFCSGVPMFGRCQPILLYDKKVNNESLEVVICLGKSLQCVMCNLLECVINKQPIFMTSYAYDIGLLFSYGICIIETL